MSEEYGHIPDGFLLNPEEIQELRANKRYLTAQAKQKLRKLRAQQQAEKIYDVWEEEWLKSKDFYEHRALAAAFRTLLEQCGYEQDGLLVVNIRDIIGIVEVLEEM
jgi:hypothetical protein